MKNPKPSSLFIQKFESSKNVLYILEYKWGAKITIQELRELKELGKLKELGELGELGELKELRELRELRELCP